MAWQWLWFLATAAVTACSTTFSPQQCTVDEDCGHAHVCETRKGLSVCVAAADAPIVIGQSAPISGTNQELGNEMKRGIELAFAEQNEAGGIRGRQLVLKFRDDAYQPELAEAVARDLVDARTLKSAPKCPTTSAGTPPVSTTALERGPDAVLAVLGNVGTPTMVRAAPVTIETGTIFFGAFTGATTILRDDQARDCRRYIFNVRASYAQEAQATAEYFKRRGVPDSQHILSFDQDDSFGQAGYDGLVAAYANVFGLLAPGTNSENAIARFRYARNDDASVPEQAKAASNRLASLLRKYPGPQRVGIMMTNTYGAAVAFIEQIRKWQYANDAEQSELDKANRLDLYFSNVSFVGPNALSERLLKAGKITTSSGEVSLTEGVVVSQVVPNYQSDASQLATGYRRLIRASGETASFTSFEAYISARVFMAGLEAHEGPFTPDTLVDTFERLPDLALGLGAVAGFSGDDHQYSNSVWGTSIGADGSFSNLYFWSDGFPIEFFE